MKFKMRKESLFISINNNISLRNWFYSGLLKELRKNYEIRIISSNREFVNFFEKNSYQTYFLKVPSVILKILNWHLNNTKTYLSSTKILKGMGESKLLNPLLKKLFIPIIKATNFKTKCDNLILTSMFGGNDYFAFLLSNPSNLYGFVNSWDNPSSRNLLELPYKKVFVWSEFVKNSLIKFSGFNKETIKITGRLQDLIPQEINERTFRKIIGTEKKIIALIHGGGDFRDIKNQFDRLIKFANKKDYFMIFRGYGIYNYDFLEQEHIDLFISIPNAISIGNKNFAGGEFDILDFNFYRCILEFSDKVFTNGSTVLIDTLRFQKKAHVILDFFSNDDYILYCYFHLFYALQNNVAKISTYNTLYSNLETESDKNNMDEIRELDIYYNGTPDLETLFFELKD